MAKKKAAEAPKLIEPTVMQVESTKTHQHELFTIVDHNGEFLVALGNQVISRNKFDTLTEAKKYIDSKPWEMILNAAAVMFTNLQTSK